MSFDYRRLPIPPVLRKALRWVNEWRDTLFYGVMVAAYAYNIAFHQGGLLFNFLIVASSREYLRLAAWVMGPECSSKNVNAANFSAMTGMTIAFLVLAVEDASIRALIKYMAPFTLSGMAISSAAYFNSGGIKNIFKTYRDTLFDWPRKIMPPKLPKKQKESLGDIWARVKSNLGGQAPVAGKAMVAANGNRREGGKQAGQITQ